MKHVKPAQKKYSSCLFAPSPIPECIARVIWKMVYSFEAHNEKIADDAARAQMTYERDFQPPTQPMTPIVHNNERGGKETRQIFMKYFE